MSCAKNKLYLNVGKIKETVFLNEINGKHILIKTPQYVKNVVKPDLYNLNDLKPKIEMKLGRNTIF